MDDGCYESAVLMVIMITNAMAWTGLTHHVEKQAGDGQHWPFLVCIQAPECCRAHRLYEQVLCSYGTKHLGRLLGHGSKSISIQIHQHLEPSGVSLPNRCWPNLILRWAGDTACSDKMPASLKTHNPGAIRCQPQCLRFQTPH